MWVDVVVPAESRVCRAVLQLAAAAPLVGAQQQQGAPELLFVGLSLEVERIQAS
jgi:hypothetical protein